MLAAIGRDQVTVFARRDEAAAELREWAAEHAPSVRLTCVGSAREAVLEAAVVVTALPIGASRAAARSRLDPGRRAAAAARLRHLGRGRPGRAGRALCRRRRAAAAIPRRRCLRRLPRPGRLLRNGHPAAAAERTGGVPEPGQRRRRPRGRRLRAALGLGRRVGHRAEPVGRQPQLCPAARRPPRTRSRSRPPTTGLARPGRRTRAGSASRASPGSRRPGRRPAPPPRPRSVGWPACARPRAPATGRGRRTRTP